MTDKQSNKLTMNILEQETALPSNKKFGLFFSAIFFSIGGFAFFREQLIVAIALVATAVILLIISLVAADYLARLNILWFKLGMLLSRIISPIVLGAIFFLLITPIAILTRIFGRDILHLKKQPGNSYWIKREPRGPLPESFKKQF